MLQIEKALEEKVTETYTETIFNKIDEVAVGLVDASDVTEELNDGATQLKDGSEKLKDNLNTIASKMIEFTDGVETAHEAISELAYGASTLSSGITELYDNSNKLRDASDDLQFGANQLADGISKTASGVNEMKENLPRLVVGTDKVQSGLQEFHNQLPKEISKKISETITEQKNPLREKINLLLDQRKTELAPGISDRLSDEISKSTAKGIVDQVNQFIQDAPDKIPKAAIDEITNSIMEESELNKNKINDDISAILLKEEIPEETIHEILNKLEDNSLGYENTEILIQDQINTAVNNILQDVQITPEQQDELEVMIKEKAQDKIVAGVNEALDDATESINGAFVEYEKSFLENLDVLAIGLEKQLQQELDEPIGQLQDGLSAINNGQISLVEGMNQLADGTNQLKDGSNKLVDGQINYSANMYLFTNRFAQANTGSNELASGANELYRGMFEITDATYQLSDGADQLSDGSDDLYDGMITLVEGTEEFNHKMREAANESSNINASEATHQMIANPVEIDNEKINQVPNYGTGFAPYFLSLGLFVGALLLSIVYPLKETSVIPKSGMNWFFRKFIGLFTIGVLQALFASGILLLVLGIEVQSIPLFILYAIITSLVFTTFIQFLVTCFDDPGRFIAIIVLILQLTTSAGTFPLELIPKALQPVNALLPMTYSVAGFKAVVSSGDYGVMWKNAGFLLGFTIVFMLLTMLYFNLIYKRKYAILNENEDALV
jgi:putative membrane protein